MLVRRPRPLASLPAFPWKNGGGTTRTLASAPEGSTLETFVWRVSLADVAESGPFSLFPEIDRTIILWRGHGMALQSPTSTHNLATPFEPYDFPGEAPIEASLLDGPTVDLNVMTRRGVATSSVSRYSAAALHAENAEEVFFLSGAGNWTLQFAGGARYTLAPDSFLHVSELDVAVRVEPVQPDSVLLCLSIDGIDKG